MAKIRKDGFHDERYKDGKYKNKRHTRLCLIVGLLFGIVGVIWGLVSGDDKESIFHLAFGLFFISAVLCGIILKALHI